MNWIKNLLTVMTATILTLLIIEILFRVFDIGYGNAPLERSKFYHHAHPKNYSFMIHQPKGEYGGHKIFYDEKGYRVSNSNDSSFLYKDNKNSIVFIGDSYTEANQVPYEDTFVKKVSNYFNINELNLGVSSYSPLIYLLQTKREIINLESNLVVLQIFRNDFSDDAKYLKKAIYKKEQLIRIDGGNRNNFISLMRKSYLLRFLRKSQLLIKELLKKDISNIKKESLIFYNDSVSDEYLKKTSDLINEIKIQLNKANKELFVFMIPSKGLSQIQECCEKDTVYKRLKHEMEKRDIIFLDISEYFSRYPKQIDLFFPIDIHLTTMGHDVLSKGLTQELQRFILIK